MEARLTTTLDEFAQYILYGIPVYTNKQEIGMLKNEIETLKEENDWLKHDMNQKEILIKSLVEKLNEERAKQMWQRELQIHQSRQNVSLETRADLLHFKTLKMKF